MLGKALSLIHTRRRSLVIQPEIRYFRTSNRFFPGSFVSTAGQEERRPWVQGWGFVLICDRLNHEKNTRGFHATQHQMEPVFKLDDLHYADDIALIPS